MIYQLTEAETNILRTYGIYDLMTPSLNEDLSDIFSGNEDDWDEFEDAFYRVRKLVPKMLGLLVRMGARTTAKAIVAVARAAYKAGKKRPDVVRKMFFMLLLSTAAYAGYNKITTWYNGNPVFSGTEVTIDEKAKMMKVTSKDKDTLIIKAPEEKGNAPLVKEIPARNDNDGTHQKSSSPITMQNTGRPDKYTISNEMLRAIAEVEKYRPRIYDALNPSRKITERDMRNMKLDLTIGYGHKLTAAERKTWSSRKSMSEKEAFRLLKKDVGSTETVVDNMLRRLPYANKVVFSQGFVDGLNSIVFNAGSGNIFGHGGNTPSDLWKRIVNVRIDKKNGCVDKSDIDYVLAAVLKQNITEKGHVYRRRAEANIMKQPVGAKLNQEKYHLIAPEHRKD